MSGKRKRPRGDTSGRYSSMIKGYVKGGTCVKRKMHADSMASGRWLPLAAFRRCGFRKLDSLASAKESSTPRS